MRRSLRPPDQTPWEGLGRGSLDGSLLLGASLMIVRFAGLLFLIALRPESALAVDPWPEERPVLCSYQIPPLPDYPWLKLPTIPMLCGREPTGRYILENIWHAECFSDWSKLETCWDRYLPPAGFRICNYNLKEISNINGKQLVFAMPDELRVRLQAAGSGIIIDRWGGR